MAANASGGYPEMMKLPPSFPFYPRQLYRYHGHGYVDNKKVLFAVAGGAVAGCVLFWFTGRQLSKGKAPLPTLSDEWKEAAEQRRLKFDADPLDRHEVGKPIADREKLRQALQEELFRKKEE